MNYILFEDNFSSFLSPFTDMHATFEIRCGQFTNIERILTILDPLDKLTLIVRSDIEELIQEKFENICVNPEIIEKSINNSTYEEGCLSVPGQFAEIDRPNKLKIEYLDQDNKKQFLTTEGFTSRIIQHELDHLNGILFVDHLSRLKRDVVIRKMKKFKKDLKTS